MGKRGCNEQAVVPIILSLLAGSVAFLGLSRKPLRVPLPDTHHDPRSGGPFMLTSGVIFVGEGKPSASTSPTPPVVALCTLSTLGIVAVKCRREASKRPNAGRAGAGAGACRQRLGLARMADSSAAEEQPKLPWWRRAAMTVKNNGVGYLVSYGLTSNINFAILFAFAWATFIRSGNGCPITIDPSRSVLANVASILLNPSCITPKFYLFYGAIYLSVGSILRPMRLGIAAGLVPSMRKFFDFVQNRLHCPRFLTWVVAILLLYVSTVVGATGCIYFACAIARVPVQGLA